MVLRGHEGVVGSAAFSLDGKWVVTASEDKTARVWRADGQGVPVMLRGHRGSVWSAAFSPDGKRVATVDERGTARRWTTDVARLQESLLTSTRVCLTPAQRQRFMRESDGEARLGHERCERSHGHMPGVASAAR